MLHTLIYTSSGNSLTRGAMAKKMGQMELRWLCCPALTPCQHQLQALVAPVGASSMTQNPRVWTGVGWKGPLKAAQSNPLQHPPEQLGQSHTQPGLRSALLLLCPGELCVPSVTGHACHPLSRCTHIPLGCTNPTQSTAFPVFMEGNGHSEVWGG